MAAITEKMEWKDEPGYCNCLLVTMTRAKISEISISSKSIVPNLEELTINVPDTQKWIKAQEFNYKNLNTLIIIEIICDSAEMRTSVFGKRTGVINVHDVQKDTGPIVQRKYYLKYGTKKMK